MAGKEGAGDRIHPEMLVGVSAVVIGVCALGVSLYETSLMREEQRAAVIPLVELSRSYYLEHDNAEGERVRLDLNIANVGIGPARVSDFQVRVDGQPQATWGETIQALIGRDQAVSYVQSTINGRTIPPDRSIKMLQLEDSDVAREILAEFNRLEIEACFCSVFDECWLASSRSFGASTPTDACRPSDTSFDQ
jgi:hypothetical protein